MSNTRHSHSYKNPYFRARKQKKTSRFYYSLLVLGIVIFSWIYLLFASSVFKITDIEISGLEKYKKTNVEKSIKVFFQNKKYLFFNLSNVLIFNKEDLEQHLSSEFLFKSIRVKKYYPHKIMLTVQEKQEKLAVYNGSQIFILADDLTVLSKKEGIEDCIMEDSTSSTLSGSATSIMMNRVLSDASTKPLPSYPIFCDAYYNNKTSGVGSTYLNKKIITILTSFIDSLHERTDIKAKLVTLQKNKTNPKLTIYTTNGWKIYLNITDDGQKQFYKLFLVFNNQIKDINKQLEYIDLRFGDRVYIK